MSICFDQHIINKMGNDQYIEEEIKTMFKVSKRLQGAFHDVKSLTYKYLLKVKQLKTKRAIQLGEIDEEKRKEEMQLKRKEKLDKTKLKHRLKDKNHDPKTSKRQSKSMSQHKQKKLIPDRKFDPNIKPQQPLSPYFLFLNDKKKQIKASSPNMSLEQISKIMRSIWDKLTDDEKRPYALEYQKLRIQYDKQMQIYYRNLSNANSLNRQQKERSKSKGKNLQKSSQKDPFDYIDELQF